MKIWTIVFGLTIIFLAAIAASPVTVFVPPSPLPGESSVCLPIADSDVVSESAIAEDGQFVLDPTFACLASPARAQNLLPAADVPKYALARSEAGQRDGSPNCNLMYAANSAGTKGGQTGCTRLKFTSLAVSLLVEGNLLNALQC